MLFTACEPKPAISAFTPVGKPTATPLPQESPTIPFVSPEPSPTPIPTSTSANATTLALSQTPQLLLTWTPQKPTPTEIAPSPEPTEEVAVCTSPGMIEHGSYSSLITGGAMAYRIYLPPCYKQVRLYPALYIFHGGAQSDSHWDELGLDEAADELILDGQIPPLIIVMPDGGEIAQNSSGGFNSFEAVVVDELIPHVENSYCVWPSWTARAIGGLSRGGYWALEIAFRNPELFRSLGAHSAALLDESAGSNLDPLVSGLTANLDALRIYIDAGQSDYTLPGLETLHDMLTIRGKEHEWILNEGSHQDAYWSSHVHDYLRWYTHIWPADESSYPDCSLDSQDR